MIWTVELASYLDDAPWPATKEELIEFTERIGAPYEVVENLMELEDSDEPYESIKISGLIIHQMKISFITKMITN